MAFFHKKFKFLTFFSVKILICQNFLLTLQKISKSENAYKVTKNNLNMQEFVQFF